MLILQKKKNEGEKKLIKKTFKKNINILKENYARNFF